MGIDSWLLVVGRKFHLSIIPAKSAVCSLFQDATLIALIAAIGGWWRVVGFAQPSLVGSMCVTF